MPRPGPRRRTVPLRLSDEEERPVREVAAREYRGNLSEAIRALLVEAITARQQAQPGGPKTHPQNPTRSNR